GPVHRALELLHRFAWELHLAVAGFAIFQLFEIFRVKSEACQIRKLRRVAELLDRKVTRQLAHRIEIRRELQVTLGSRMDIYRAENKYLVRGRRIQNFRDRFSFADFPDLIVIQAGKLVKELIRLGGAVRGSRSVFTERPFTEGPFTEREEKQGEQNHTGNRSAHGTPSASLAGQERLAALDVQSRR